MLAPLCFVGQFLTSPEGIALISSAVAWLLHRKGTQSKRWQVIQERAEIVFDGMEQWAKYQKAKNGKAPASDQKLEAYLEYVEKAVVAVGGGGKLSTTERAALTATAAVRAWLMKDIPPPAKPAPAKK